MRFKTAILILIAARWLPAGDVTAAAWLQRGKECLEHEEWRQAADSFENSLKLLAGSDEAHLLLGLAYRHLGKQDNATSEMLEAFRLNPKSYINAYIAGHQLAGMGRPKDALVYFYKAVELNPHFARGLQALGTVHSELGNEGLAEAYFRKAAALAADPEDVGAAIDLAWLLVRRGETTDMVEALALAQKVKALRPKSAEAHYIAGKALFKLKRFPEAIAELRQAEALAPADSKAPYLLLQTYRATGMDEQADKERRNLTRILEESAANRSSAASPK